jgi:hypothetical protein
MQSAKRVRGVVTREDVVYSQQKGPGMQSAERMWYTASREGQGCSHLRGCGIVYSQQKGSGV